MTYSEEQALGAMLKERRLELGSSLEEIASKTRIRRVYLEALEDDHYDVFPGEVYLRGFLRGYAGALELECEKVLRKYREQAPPVRLGAGETLSSVPLPSAVLHHDRRGKFWIGAALLIVAIIVAVASVLFSGNRSDFSSEISPAIKRQASPSAAVDQLALDNGVRKRLRNVQHSEPDT